MWVQRLLTMVYGLGFGDETVDIETSFAIFIVEDLVLDVWDWLQGRDFFFFFFNLSLFSLKLTNKKIVFIF